MTFAHQLPWQTRLAQGFRMLDDDEPRELVALECAHGLDIRGHAPPDGRYRGVEILRRLREL